MPEKENTKAINGFNRSSILDIATTWMGIVWTVLALIKFTTESLFGRMFDFNLLRTFYVCLAIALANLIDGAIALSAKNKPQTTK